MNDIKQLATTGLLMFFTITIGMTCLYFFLHNFATVYNFNYITTVVSKVGLIAAIIPTFTIFLIYFSFKKINNKLLKTISVFILFLILIFVMYWHTLNMTFYQLEDEKLFIVSLIESF